MTQTCSSFSVTTSIAKIMEAHIAEKDKRANKHVENNGTVFTNEISREDVAKYYSSWASEYETVGEAVTVADYIISEQNGI